MDGDGMLDQDELRTVTDAEGKYAFLDLAPGLYAVREVMQDGWMQTAPGSSGTGQGFSSSSIAVSISGVEASVNTPGAAAARASWDLIGLNAFRADPRFAGLDGSGTTVAVLDTGIDTDHPFFGPDRDADGVADRIVYQYDFVENDSIAQDLHGHGTHVASILASSDPMYGGIAPGIGLIVLRVLDAKGQGSLGAVERALAWVAANAAEYNIAAVNMSFGDGGNYDREAARYGLGDELAALWVQGVALVAAAGNGFYGAGSRLGVAYPAADPNSMGIGSVWTADLGGPYAWSGDAIDYTTGADRLTSFSQRHEVATEVFTPGTLITAAGLDGGLATFSGTSMAAPQIAGLAALARQVADRTLGRSLTAEEFRHLLQTTGAVITDGDNENDNVVNTGLAFRRLDVLALAEEISRLPSVLPGDGSTPGQGSGGSGQEPLHALGFHNVQILPGGLVVGLDFGNLELAILTGRIFHDLDGDGIEDSGEAGLAGWTVFLVWCFVDPGTNRVSRA